MPAFNIGSLCLSLALSIALSGSLSSSLWLSRARCPAHSGFLSGSLWLSLALYGSPNLLTKSLLGSEGPCSARSSATALFDFLQVCQHHNRRCLENVPIKYYKVHIAGPYMDKDILMHMHICILAHLYYLYKVTQAVDWQILNVLAIARCVIQRVLSGVSGDDLLTRSL